MINECKFRPPNEKYLTYLRSAEWKKRQKAVMDRCDGICERCQKRPIDDIHHITYDRVYNENLDDLQGLCEGCHSLVHGKTNIDPLLESVGVKVTQVMIKYFDISTRRFRQLKHSVDRAKTGYYIVPQDIFFDKKGKPVINLKKWEEYEYRESYRFRKIRSMYSESEILERKLRYEFELQRYLDYPDFYKQYDSIDRTNHKVTKEIIRQSRTLVDGSDVWDILNIRKTKTCGTSLSMQQDTGRTIKWCTLTDIGSRLMSGELLFDTDRKLWIQIPK